MYVYGVTSAGARARGRGVADAEVTTLEHGELAAIVSRVGDVRLRAKRRDLLRHSDVLQDAFGNGPVVPLRFGTIFASEESVVADFLAARYEELVALVQQVDGLGEFRVRASFAEQELLREIVEQDRDVAALRAATAGVPAGDPRLVQLGEAVARAVSDRTLRAADELVGSLSGAALRVDVDEPREQLEVVRGSFLVERRRSDAFRRAAESFAERHRDRITVELIGPMPPHSFVAFQANGRA